MVSVAECKMKKTLNSVFLLFCFFIVSCAPPKTIYSYEKTETKKNYDIKLNKSFNTVWNSVIDYSSKSFFGIDNFEKDSGLVTVSYSGSPVGYVDCGTFDYDGFISNGTQVKNYSGNFQEFAQIYYNASLNGRMNILVKKRSESETYVRVNTRYVFSFTRPHPLGIYHGSESVTWTFNAGDEANVSLIFGDMDIGLAVTEPLNITCQPTYKLEQNLLSNLK